ncbi:hypothetical protein BRL93_11830 [Xanthomonas oryzae pv. oryzae]|nr:hypothetical protein BRL93_11830 [Xanthomonas oryzae pv. oryzae]
MVAGAAPHYRLIATVAMDAGGVLGAERTGGTCSGWQRLHTDADCAVVFRSLDQVHHCVDPRTLRSTVARRPRAANNKTWRATVRWP